VHALRLAWTLPLAQRISREGAARREVAASALVILLAVLLIAGAVLAILAEARSPALWCGCCAGSQFLSGLVDARAH